MAYGKGAGGQLSPAGRSDMQAGLKFIPLIIAGLTAIVWGLPAAHRLRQPLDIVAALVVLAGVVAAAMGVLLLAIPNFFR